MHNTVEVGSVVQDVPFRQRLETARVQPHLWRLVIGTEKITSERMIDSSLQVDGHIEHSHGCHGENFCAVDISTTEKVHANGSTHVWQCSRRST